MPRAPMAFARWLGGPAAAAPRQATPGTSGSGATNRGPAKPRSSFAGKSWTRWSGVAFQTRSSTIAMPWPTPMHMVVRA